MEAMGGKLSHSVMNPAIAFGTYLISFIFTWDVRNIINLWIYIFFHIVAGMMAKYFYVEIMKNGKNPFDLREKECSVRNDERLFKKIINRIYDSLQIRINNCL